MTSLLITRTLAASSERLWRAWTDPVELAAWMWPPSFGTECLVQLEVGGNFRIASESAGMAVSGEYLEVEEPHRLVFTWRWDGEDAETLVTVTFAPAGSETRLEVLHERFETVEECASHEQGWNDCLDRLPSHLGI
jgi:uncharacterized protein YndB with AHSA1/START domain